MSTSYDAAINFRCPSKIKHELEILAFAGRYATVSDLLAELVKPEIERNRTLIDQIEAIRYTPAQEVSEDEKAMRLAMAAYRQAKQP